MNYYATEHLTLSYKVVSISYPKIDQFEHVENVGVILSEIHGLLSATLHHKQITGIKKKKTRQNCTSSTYLDLERKRKG